MKTEKMKRLGHYLWRILVVLLVNVMILLMLWNSGGAKALSKYGSRGREAVTRLPGHCLQHYSPSSRALQSVDASMLRSSST